MKGTGSCPSGVRPAKAGLELCGNQAGVSSSPSPSTRREYSVISYTKWYLAEMRSR